MISPTADAILDAWVDQVYDQCGTYAQGLAAVLRVLDSQLGHEILGVRGVDCSQIQLIAAELEKR